MPKVKLVCPVLAVLEGGYCGPSRGQVMQHLGWSITALCLGLAGQPMPLGGVRQNAAQ